MTKTFAATALALMMAHPQTGLAADDLNSPSFMVMVDEDTHAGRRKAGRLCFPSGRFVTSDFVKNNNVFKIIFLSEAENIDPNINRSLRNVLLSRVQVSLCDRKYFLGSSGTYSGDATFVFEASWENGRSGSHEIRLDIAKNERASPEEIFTRAVQVLIRDLSANH